MKVRSSLLAAGAAVLLSAPVLTACGGSDEAAEAPTSPAASASSAASTSGSATPSASGDAAAKAGETPSATATGTAGSKPVSGKRPSVDTIYDAVIAGGGFDDRKEAARCIATVFHESALSDGFLQLTVDPEVKYTPTEAETKTQMEVMGKAVKDCKLEE